LVPIASAIPMTTCRRISSPGARPVTKGWLPQDGQAFIGKLKSEMTEVLTRLDRGLPRNGTVRIDPRRHHPIIVSPLDAQSEPPNLEALKDELSRRWPMTGLLDILRIERNRSAVGSG
jgi:hypothetical protein